MKTIYIKILFVLALSGSLVSCSSWLDNRPDGKIVEEEFWKTKADVDAMMGTCYLSMIQADYMRRLIVWGELRSDNVTATNYSALGQLTRIEEANISPDDEYTQWLPMYKTINNCNLLIKKAPLVTDPNFTRAELNVRLAEALAIRALTYFYLVRTFKDIPLVLEPSISDAQDYNVFQSSEDEVLDQIEADLIQAEQWALTSYTLTKYNKGRITKKAIRALLADVYLWRNKYSQCIAYCDKVIADNSLKLIDQEMSPFTQIFYMKNSRETIFELQFENSNNFSNSAVNTFYGTKDRNKGDFVACDYMCLTSKNEVFDKYGATVLSDVRRQDCMAGLFNLNTSTTGNFSIFKYLGVYRQPSTSNIYESTYTYRESSNFPNWIVYRLADVMLMKAEALVESVEATDHSNIHNLEALSLVNKVFMRSNPTILPEDSLKLDIFPTKASLQDLVSDERQRELLFEGKRWYDLVRMARRDHKSDRLVKNVVRKYTQNASLIQNKLMDMNSLYFPINAQELRINPNLKQNPFYVNNANSTN